MKGRTTPRGMRRPVVLAVLVLAAGLCIQGPIRGADPDAVVVEPAELMHRADHVNKLIAVDDRVARFQWHNDREDTVPDRPYDEIYLKRTPVAFRLPPHLRFETAPRAGAARIEGILRREGSQWVCDVTALELFPSDLERLERAVAALDPRDPRDAERRSAWARWAETRARAFKDPREPNLDPKDAALLERARQLEAETIQIEADRPGADLPRRWLELAQRARQRELPEPVPSALAHRAFAARLAAAKAEGVDAWQSLVKDIEAFWPASPAPSVGSPDLETWLAPYTKDPATTYRIAPEPVRAALDHRLWSDATLGLAERRMAAEPQHALELAQAAARALRDRPQDATRLLDRAVKQASRNLTSLRQAEVIELARVYRETLHQPEAARDLLRRWLDDQRHHRLSPSDAEGRVLLAKQYDTLLGDRALAVSLLRDAWQIDPQSPEVADAFRRWGFRRVNDQWIEPPPARGAGPVGAADGADSGRPRAPLASTTLRGLTPQEVRVRLGGKPDRILFSASQGQLIEQWIYRGANQDQYVNFLHTSGDPLPKVVAFYARPRSRLEPARPR